MVNKINFPILLLTFGVASAITASIVTEDDVKRFDILNNLSSSLVGASLALFTAKPPLK